MKKVWTKVSRSLALGSGLLLAGLASAQTPSGGGADPTTVASGIDLTPALGVVAGILTVGVSVLVGLTIYKLAKRGAHRV